MNSVKQEEDEGLRILLSMSHLRFTDTEATLRGSKMVKEKFPQRLLALLTDTVEVVIEFVGGGAAGPLDPEYMPMLRNT
jgi:hypothetical protein